MTILSSIEQATKSVLGAIAPGTEPSTDILDTLHAEHDEVQGLLKELNDSESPAEQIAVVAKIKQALIPHAKAEEQVVYDRVAALKGEKPKIESAEGYSEHALAAATLKSLDTLAANSPEFKANAKVLKELLEHHVKEEESSVWDEVKKNFSDAQRQQMNTEYLATKQTIKIS